MANVTQFLESLSNKELKDKCDEYNMKNIPVTNSTRKLLIRKLLLVMSDGKDTNAKQPKRRQTIQVVRTDVGLEDVEDDEDDDLFKESRRLNQTFPNASLSKKTTTRTASSRKAADDLSESLASTTSTSGRRKASETNASLNKNLNSKSSTDQINKSNDSAKRSINLSRSAINTTSYCVEVEHPTSRHTEYEDYSDEEDIRDDEEMEIDEGEYQIENVQSNYSYPYSNEYNKQVQIEHNIEVNRHIPSRNSCLKKRNLSQMNISPSKARVSFYEPEEGSKITYESSSRDFGSQQPSIATYEAEIGDVNNANPTLYPFDMLNTAAKNMQSSFASASSYTSYTPLTTPSNAYQRKSINNSFKTSYGLRDDDDESVNVVDSSGSSGSEYENSSVSSKHKTKSKDFSNEIKFNSTLNPTSMARSPLARRSLRPEATNESPMVHFMDMLKSLDRKYNISTIIFYSLAFIVLMFILALFFF